MIWYKKIHETFPICSILVEYLNMDSRILVALSLPLYSVQSNSTAIFSCLAIVKLYSVFTISENLLWYVWYYCTARPDLDRSPNHNTLYVSHLRRSYHRSFYSRSEISETIAACVFYETPPRSIQHFPSQAQQSEWRVTIDCILIGQLMMMMMMMIYLTSVCSTKVQA